MAGRIASWLRFLQLRNRLYLLALLISVVVFRIAGSVISWLRSLQLTDHLYYLGFLIATVGVVTARISGDPSDFFYVAVPIAMVPFIMGFGFWLWPWIPWIWRFRLEKFILTSSSAAIWVFALILTRMFAAEVLGLPPQDFEVTVRVWTFLFFLLSWISIVAVLALASALVFLLVAAPLSLITLICHSKYFPERSMEIDVRETHI